MNKKIISSLCLLVLCVLLLPVTVMAYNKSVTISSASGTNTSFNVKGETQALAVVVQLRDTDGNILAMQSFGTVSGVFDATINEGISLADATKYYAYVADYEGGDWAIAEFTVKPKEEPTPEPSPTPSPEPSPGSTPSPKPTETPKPDGTPTPGGNQGGSSNNSDNGTASSPKVEEVPKTNDDNNILLWSIMLISGIVVMGSVGTVIVKKINK